MAPVRAADLIQANWTEISESRDERLPAVFHLARGGGGHLGAQYALDRVQALRQTMLNFHFGTTHVEHVTARGALAFAGESIRIPVGKMLVDESYAVRTLGHIRKTST